MADPLCPWCGAYSTRRCEIEEEAGCCPWQEQLDAEEEDTGFWSAPGMDAEEEDNDG